MPTYSVTAPNGKSLDITGDRPPTEAELHDIFAKAGVQTGPAQPAMNFATVNGERVPVEDPNTVGTFLSHVGAQVNPVAAVKSTGDALLHPIEAAKAIGAAQGALFDKAKASYDQGDYATAARHFVDYLLPLIGPPLDTAADRMQAGHGAAGAGDAVGLGLAMFGPKAVASGVQAFKGSGSAQTISDTADAAANRRVADVMAPKVGPNKVRFGNMAADVAPTVARETTGITRSTVADSVAARLEDATAALDTAADSRLNARTFSTQPILDSLQAARARLTAEAVKGSRPIPSMNPLTEKDLFLRESKHPSYLGEPAEPDVIARRSDLEARPIGQDVTPAPNAPRAALLDQAIREVKQLGPVARYEPLRRIREAYDSVARTVYSPAMTQDFMAKMGEKLGAADVTGTLRDYLAKLDPNTAAANADYSLWKKASDVLTAAEETERTRPTVGRSIMARGLGAAAGAAEGGGVGAIVGAVVGPMVERGLSNLAPAIKLIAARQLASLADALRTGNTAKASSALGTLKSVVLPASAMVKSARATVVPLGLPAAADQAPGAPQP